MYVYVCKLTDTNMFYVAPPPVCKGLPPPIINGFWSSACYDTPAGGQCWAVCNTGPTHNYYGDVSTRTHACCKIGTALTADCARAMLAAYIQLPANEVPIFSCVWAVHIGCVGCRAPLWLCATPVVNGKLGR